MEIFHENFEEAILQLVRALRSYWIRLSVLNGACPHYPAYFIKQNSVPSRFVRNMRLSAITVSAISGVYCILIIYVIFSIT